MKFTSEQREELIERLCSPMNQPMSCWDYPEVVETYASKHIDVIETFINEPAQMELLT